MSLLRKIIICVTVVLATALPADISAQEMIRSDRALPLIPDSTRESRIDSIYRSLTDTAAWNRELEFARELQFIQESDSILMDQLQAPANQKKRLTWKEKDSLAILDLKLKTPEWEPIPRKATIMSLLIPGGGQIYNRKYWKLPIVYGGFAGCIYALTWNQATYTDYRVAYMDIMDDDPNTRSYEDFLPPNYEIDTDVEEWLKSVFKNRKDKYRRYRDMSIFAFAGMYLISAVDAYVDAELSHFDISKDLSLDLTPQIMLDRRGQTSTGLSLAISF